IKFELIIQCNETIFGIKETCETINDQSICKRENLINLSNNTCEAALLQMKQPNCLRINSQHIPEHEEILPGIILLNVFDGTINIDQEQLHLHGSYLVQTKNASITIKGTSYTNREYVHVDPLPPMLQIVGNKTEIEQVFSLEMVKELNFNNTAKIQLMKEDQ
ncbi:hypothetical protein KR222_007130, partial [Zaprionus bogoriensis]